MNGDMAREGRRLSVRCEEAPEVIREAAERLAELERSYREVVARAWVEVPREIGGARRLASEIEADVRARTADARYARDAAEGARVAALEASRNARQQLSAWQTAVTADRAESELARTGPEWTP